MMNLSKVTDINRADAEVVKIEKKPVDYGNLVSCSIDTDGAVFNGCGYMDDYRMTSSGGIDYETEACITGFMPYRKGKILVYGSSGAAADNGGQYVGVFDESFTKKDVKYFSRLVNEGRATYEKQQSGLYLLQIIKEPEEWIGAAFFRVSVNPGKGENLMVTEKEEPVLLWEKPLRYKNYIMTSIDTDGSIFNGCGYICGYRVRSSGAVGAENYSAATGYIPVKAGDTIMFTAGVFGNWGKSATVRDCIHYADDNFNALGSFTTQPAHYGICTAANSVVTEVEDNIWSVVVPDNDAICYIRISMSGTYEDSRHGADFIVTVNEEIK